MPRDTFRTFCHISEYGDAGYANLHRMVAASSPLVLWAPSSARIASPVCRLGATEFVRLVEKQTIRVIGREDWIMNRAFRDRRATGRRTVRLQQTLDLLTSE